MSDPLTALMHAVQVMNLLKTLITKTLREREETETTGGYSPMSFHSSDRQSADEYDSQQEMDTSCELRENRSDCDDHAHYSHCSEEEKEAESLSEIEECFLKQLDENKKEFSEPAGYLQEYVSLRSYSPHSMESPISTTTDSKTGDACLSSIDGGKLRTTLTAVDSNVDTSSPSVGCTGTNDVEMMDKFTDSGSPVPLLASS